jgi:hypothetical protein
MVKFRHITDYENGLYVDDINIQNTTDVQNLVMTNDVQMYPNPSTGVINMDVNLFNRDNLTINVTNSIGQRVSQVSDENTFGGHYVIDLSNEPNGVYFIEVQTGTEVTTRRVVISH